MTARFRGIFIGAVVIAGLNWVFINRNASASPAGWTTGARVCVACDDAGSTTSTNSLYLTTPPMDGVFRFKGNVEIIGDLKVSGEVRTKTPVEYRTALEFVPVLSIAMALLFWQHWRVQRLMREVKALRVSGGVAVRSNAETQGA